MKPLKSFLSGLWEVTEVILILAITVFFIRYFLVQPFIVSGASMEPTFKSGDYLLIDELSYFFREPQRGEVIVFHYPNDERFYYIKRVIGLPNEKIKIENGKIFIFNKDNPQGFKLVETYISDIFKDEKKSIEINLKENEYFVLGDNRRFSFDSRNWGPVKRDEIVGRVWLRLWPISQAMAFKAPSY